MEDEIKLKTAPADFRFPTTNQTRHCFTRYIEFHRCTTAKGGESNDCERFAKYYCIKERFTCLHESHCYTLIHPTMCVAQVEKWNEQRESGTFPGPL